MVKILSTYGQKLLDPRWQKIRLEVFQRENFTCQYCRATDLTLHVHHLCYASSGNPWDVDISALQCLCEECHKVDHLNLSILEHKLIEGLRIIVMCSEKDNEFPSFMLRDINSVILKIKS